MKFLLKNDQPRVHMGLLPGQGYIPGTTAREVSEDEMKKLAASLVKAMVPREHLLISGPQNVNDLSKGTASLPQWRDSAKRIHVFVVDESGKELELAASDLAALFKDDIDAHRAARVAAHKARIQARSDRALQLQR